MADNVTKLPQIKSRARVRELAEVYTRPEEVNAMLDLVGECTHLVETRFLEPACGNGNFLVEILARKLTTAARKAKNAGRRLDIKQDAFEFNVLVAAGAIYAVDICPENVEQARERMRGLVRETYSTQFNTLKPREAFWRSLDYVLSKNVIVGDMLKGTHLIEFTEFSAPKAFKFKQRVFALDDMLVAGAKGQEAAPRYELPIQGFLELGSQPATVTSIQEARRA